MLLLYKKIVEAMWEVAENDPSVSLGSSPAPRRPCGRAPFAGVIIYGHEIDSRF